MTLVEFIKKYIGKTKGYSTDFYYKGQCLSIVKLYIKECFKIDPPPSGTNSAYGYWSKFPNPLGVVFKKVANTSKLIPEKGWIAIWKPWSGNSSGHIAICGDGSTKSLLHNHAQNWSSKKFTEEITSYDNVVGYLKPKIINSKPNMTKDEQNAMLILKKFKEENKKLKDGNLEGAISAMVGWAKSEEKLEEVEKNLKNSLKTNTTLLAKITELEKLDLKWQNKVKIANEKTVTAETLANSNIKLYKNKNDEFNAVKYMTSRWVHLIKFCVLKFKGIENEDYLKEELPKVIKSLNKEA